MTRASPVSPLTASALELVSDPWSWQLYEGNDGAFAAVCLQGLGCADQSYALAAVSGTLWDHRIDLPRYRSDDEATQAAADICAQYAGDSIHWRAVAPQAALPFVTAIGAAVRRYAAAVERKMLATESQSGVADEDMHRNLVHWKLLRISASGHQRALLMKPVDGPEGLLMVKARWAGDAGWQIATEPLVDRGSAAVAITRVYSEWLAGGYQPVPAAAAKEQLALLPAALEDSLDRSSSAA